MQRWLRWCVLSMVLGTFGTPAAFGHEIAEQIISKATQSTVSLLPQQLSQKQLQEEPEGSGIVIGDGTIIVTAAHVLGRSPKVLVRTSKGRVFAAEHLASDPETDIAILKSPVQLPAMAFGQAARPAQSVCAIGNSFGLGLSVSCGVVSAVGRSGIGFNPIEDFVQTDAAINPGMSGGALIDARGEVIGLLSAIFTKSSDANIGVNFAVSAELVRSVVDDLLEDRTINRRSPGVRVKQHQGDGAAGLMGARVVQIKPGSPEQRAGIAVNDIILAVAGKRLIKAAAYRAILAKLDAASKTTMLLYRDGKTLEVQVDFSQ